jgi:hypothetical protein
MASSIKHSAIGVNHPAESSTLFDLPLLDELRTYCYEHKIEEIPALLAV